MRILLFFAAFSCSQTFAQVQLDVQYDGSTQQTSIELHSYAEYITYSKEPVTNELSLRSQEQIAVDLEIDAPCLLLIRTRYNSLNFFVQPEFSYVLLIDDDSIQVRSEDKLNQVIANVELTFQEYLNQLFTESSRKQAYKILEMYIRKVNGFSEGRAAQMELISGKILLMKAIAYGLNNDKKKYEQLLNEGFVNQTVQFTNPAQIDFLKDYYLRKFRNLKLRERHYSSEVSPLTIAIKETATSPVLHIQQIALIGLIEELYNSFKADDKKVAVNLLDSLSIHGLHEHIKLASSNLSERYSNIEMGAQLNDFNFVNVAGHEMNVSDFHGKYTLLDFWFIGCAPCHRGIPYLKKLTEKYDDCLSVVGINPIDDSMSIVKYKEKNGLSWTLATLDKNDQVLADLNVTGYPSYFLLNPNGEIILIPAFTGLIEDQFVLMEEKLDEGCDL